MRFIFAFLLFALTTATAAANDQQDPCSKLNGHWKGKWYNSYSGCTWDTEFEVSNYKQNVQIVASLPSTTFCREYTYVLTGTCVNGKIAITSPRNMSGFMHGDLFTLVGGYDNVYGKPQSTKQ